VKFIAFAVKRLEWREDATINDAGVVVPRTVGYPGNVCAQRERSVGSMNMKKKKKRWGCK
jgi:hypothetical protein